MQAGDFLLVRSPGVIPRLIGLGELLRDGKPWDYWTHAAFIVNDSGATIEAQAKGIVPSRVSAHPDSLVVPSGLSSEGRENAVRFAESCLGDHYGYLTILSIAADLITPRALILRSPRTLICSEFVARCLEHGGWISPELDAGRVKPSNLAKWFDATPRLTPAAH